MKEVAREQRRRELEEELDAFLQNKECTIPSLIETLRVARSYDVEIKAAVSFLCERLRASLDEAMARDEHDPKQLGDAIRQCS